jgi:hypothetical protein
MMMLFRGYWICNRLSIILFEYTLTTKKVPAVAIAFWTMVSH